MDVKINKQHVQKVKKIFIFLAIFFYCIGIVLWNNSASAELPPEIIEQRNLEAKEILTGTIWGIYNAPSDWVYPHEDTDKLKYFVLKIKEIQKNNRRFRSGGCYENMDKDNYR